MSAKIISYLILAEYLNQPTRILPGSGPQDKDASDKIDSWQAHKQKQLIKWEKKEKKPHASASFPPLLPPVFCMSDDYIER